MRRIGRRGDSAGPWLVAGSVGVSVLALAVLLALLVYQSVQAFVPARVVDIRWRSVNGTDQALAALVAEEASLLIVRRSELQRVGSTYLRIARSDVVSVSTPVDALTLRLRDGREIYLRGEPARVQAAASDTPLDSPEWSTELSPQRRDVVEVLAPNTLSLLQRSGLTATRVAQFVRGSSGDDGVVLGLFPALIGTVVLVILMSALVMPLGVLVALWLHEYAHRNAATQLLRAAIANLAGVPSVIYGLFGVVLFVHTLGGQLDHWLFSTAAPRPTFGRGGLLWAALTLALLTLPVVVVATEEGLARVPTTLRLGALALGATRAEVLWRVVLPVARPALLTALILAIARAAGEVAPLMLVGVVKFAPTLPVDGEFPYLHLSRQFMHLGHAVYDQGLASGDAVRGPAHAYAAALLLLVVVVSLNVSAILVRNRLRARTQELSA